MSQSVIENGISVVIPNYNGQALLGENLPSIIKALDNTNLPYQVIVSDDASTDKSINFIEKNYPEVQLLTTELNSGFSTTCNRGIMHARFNLTCVTNSDVTFDENYFKNCIKYFADKSIFAIKGDIYNYSGEKSNITSIDKTTQTYFKRGFIRFNTDIIADNSKFGSDIGNQYVALGCCFIANTKLLQSIGGYNEIFSPYYWEDSDLALVALEKGHSLKYVPECIVYHKASSTIAATQTNYKRKLISNRNKFIFSWLHMKSLRMWSAHLLTVLFGLMTRWIIIDTRFYLSLSFALYRITKFKIIKIKEEYREKLRLT